MPRRVRKSVAQCLERFARLRKIDLVEHEERRFFRQLGFHARELVLDGLFVGEHLFERLRAVEEVYERPRPLDVFEKLIAESGAFVRAFDQAGNVDHDERLFVGNANDAELRLERREG